MMDGNHPKSADGICMQSVRIWGIVQREGRVMSGPTG